jgi:2-phosphoglycerate kinase
MHMLLKQISNPDIKIINIYGESGVGKTRLVKEIARYINLRKIITNGVYFLDLTYAYS